MKKILILSLLMVPFTLFSQVIITGKVINATDKTPVPYASVFLSNSVVGAQSTDDGSFRLSNVKNGQYDLVISFIGFEPHHQTITVNGSPLNLPTIAITPKNTQLKEVKIGPPDLKRDMYLKTFMEEFLGQSANAQNCKILNPDLINISYDAQNRTLDASSDDFLIIENKALGYKVHYQLTKFIKNYQSNMLYYEGSVLFEDLKGRPTQIRKWQKNRLAIYKGSDMHFLRSIFYNQLGKDGFRALKLIRKPNPARPTDSLINAKLRLFRLHTTDHPDWKDSIGVWRSKQQLPKTIEYLVTKPLGLNDFVTRTDNKSMLALRYTDYLYVIYTQKHDGSHNGEVYHPLDMPDYPTTVITLNKPYAVFDSNGIFLNPTTTTFEGAWGLNRVADLLPVDYDPVEIK